MSSSRTALTLVTVFAWADGAWPNWAACAMAEYYALFDANGEVRAFPALVGLPEESENHFAAGWERGGRQVREMNAESASRGFHIARSAPIIVAPVHQSRSEQGNAQLLALGNPAAFVVE